jgi:glycosyltransferase involved in cell wall biosynthesis
MLLIPTLDRSGAEKQLMLLATRLPRDEFDVHVVTLDRAGPYASVIESHGLPVTVLGKRLRFDVGALLRLRRFLRELQPRILHSWLFSANTASRLVRGGRQTFRTVVSERCVDSWKSGWQLWLDRRLISRTDRLVANSRSVAGFYGGIGFPADRMRVIPNGVEPPAPPGISRTQLLKECKIPSDAKLVACVGRLARQKRIDDLLWGLQVLRQADPRAHMLVIGDGPERGALEQHARDVECVEQVRFLGHRDDAAQLMQLSDVFWLGSDFEGMSNSLMEAMSCGLPVVVSDIPPNRELVTHDTHGYIANVGDGVAFAQYTVRLFQDPELARRLGDQARTRMQSEFSVDTMVQKHVELYRELCDTGAGERE